MLEVQAASVLGLESSFWTWNLWNSPDWPYCSGCLVWLLNKDQNFPHLLIFVTMHHLWNKTVILTTMDRITGAQPPVFSVYSFISCCKIVTVEIVSTTELTLWLLTFHFHVICEPFKLGLMVKYLGNWSLKRDNRVNNEIKHNNFNNRWTLVPCIKQFTKQGGQTIYQKKVFKDLIVFVILFSIIVIN